jgi:hypothetical protein
MASFIVYGDSSGQVTVAAPAAAGTNTITFPAETGTLITSAYTGAALTGQIAWDTTVKTSGFTAVAYGGYFCNTTSAAFTVTLPATPTRGQFVVIVDYAGTAATNNITVNPNGGKINGGSSNITISTNRSGLTLTYIDVTQGWLASSNVYGGNPPFAQPYTASYLVVAGGGAGSGAGDDNAGGGGAGGLLTGTAALTSGTTYTITVGAGGTCAVNATGTNGSDSVLSGTGITTQTAIGGGRGGRYSTTGGAGGSGGGGSGYPTNSAGGAGTPGQGNAGSSGSANAPGGGGGGGAASTRPNGGVGSANPITGSTAGQLSGGIYYLAGGGGGGFSGLGGLGGGGNGSTGEGNGVAGTTNTGGGGGGAYQGNNVVYRSGGAGGSGLVILSFPTANYSGTTTGSPTVTTSGSNTILTYTGSGTYTA